MIKILIFSLLLFSLKAQSLSIIIDPGHGGNDYGAKGLVYENRKTKKQVLEKDIVFKIAKKIHSKLKKKYKVYLTRSIDRTVKLDKRASISDTLKADIFISIHANSNKSHQAHGFETYYLDNNRDGAVKKLEAVENSNLKGNELIVNKIIIDLIIERTVQTSKSLAKKIHTSIARKIKKKYRMKNRGVKAGLFYVLAMSKIPGVLLEVGFISNKEEAKKITSDKFQEDYANSVVRGIDQYFSELQKKNVKKSNPFF